MNFHGRIALFAFALLVAVMLPASSFAGTASKHHLVMYKAEKQVTLPEGELSDWTVSCNSGDLATDGMWRVDDVQYNAQLADPGEPAWDLHTGVNVLRSEAISDDTYRFTFKNNSSDDAQLKIFVTCLGAKTAPDTHQHAWSWSPVSHDYVQDESDFSADAAADGYGCPVGTILVSPGWRINNHHPSDPYGYGFPGYATEDPDGFGGFGYAENFASYPSNDLRSWTWKFYVLHHGTSISVSAKCLTLKSSVVSGHYHRLLASLRKSPVEHFDKGNNVHEWQLHCGDDAKGLVGGYDLSDSNWHWYGYYHDFHHAWDSNYPGSFWLGMDPRPKTRAYRTLGGSYRDFSLVCFNDRTSRPYS